MWEGVWNGVGNVREAGGGGEATNYKDGCVEVSSG